MKVDKISFRLGRIKGKSEKKNEIEEEDSEISKRKKECAIHSLCSFQRRMGPLEYRKWRRIHGLQLPLHPQQVAGWIILLAVSSTTFFVLIPALRPLVREAIFVLFGVLFSLHILSHLAALLLDPADPELRALKEKFTVPEFDRSKHAHVIENGRCHLCNIKTSSSKTKHCSVCNKCIDHFDHHCKWLNHCIGGRNYKAFLLCVVSAVAASLVVVGVSVLEIVYYHIDPELLTVFPNHQNGTAPEFFIPGSVFLGVVTILGLLSATTAGLLLHLCLFHCYISILGINTYEYIRNYRQENNGNTNRNPTLPCRKPENGNDNLQSLEIKRKSCKKFESCFCYSCSGPPENEEGQSCIRNTKFSCLGGNIFSQRKDRGRALERQNTDPEFVDRIVKPFLITLNDERTAENSEGISKSEEGNHDSSNQSKCAEFFFLKSKKSSDNDVGSHSEEIINQEIKKRQGCKGLCSRFFQGSFARSSEISAKIKSNQIRPSTANELNETTEKLSAKKIEHYPGDLDLKTFITMRTKVLPELSEALKNTHKLNLREVDNFNDLNERLVHESVLSSNVSPIARKIKKKSMIKLPKSPLLSPIRESGLSNPGSPRIDLVSPAPVFARSSTPETSMIFLSNPNSPSSSSSPSDDEEVVMPTPIINKLYNSEDILQTPYLPRKVYTHHKDEPVFVIKPSKVRASKWIDVEIPNRI